MSNIQLAENKSVNDELTAEFDSQNPDILNAKFLIKNKFIYAHKWMLKQRYPRLFYFFFDSSHEVTTVDNDVSFEEFKAFIRFLYTHEIDLNEENVYRFTCLAEQYEIVSLQKLCDDYLARNITLDNVHLLSVCVKLFALPKAYGRIYKLEETKISKNIDLSKLSKPIMQILLKGQIFGTLQEEKFQKALEWAKVQCTEKKLEPSGENCRNQLGEILKIIKFVKMDIKFIETTVAESQILTKIELLKIISNIQFSEDKALNKDLTVEFDSQSPAVLDAKFVVENKFIYAHKWMLKQRYPLLFYFFFDSSHKVTTVDNDVSFEEFKAFIRFLYTHEIDLNEENVYSFTTLAFRYEIISLQKLCGTYLAKVVTFQNVPRHLECAEFNQMHELQKKIYAFIKKNKTDFLKNVTKLSKPVLKAFIRAQTSRTTVQTPDTLFEESFKNALEWAKAQCAAKKLEPSGENCRNLLGDIIKIIKFVKMDIEFIETTVAESQILTKIELLKIISNKRFPENKSVNDELTAEFDNQNSDILDAKFLVENKPIYAFKLMLKIRCPILIKLFTDSNYYTDVSDGVKIGGDVHYDEFKAFLRYLCTNQIEINEENIYALTDLATQYDVGSLRKECEEYLAKNVTLENAQIRLEYVVLYDMPKALKNVSEFIKLKELDFWKKTDILKLSRSMLKAFIQTQMIDNFPEVEYEKAMEWAEGHCIAQKLEPTVSNCRKQLGDIFDIIRFEEMSPRFITTKIAESQIFTDKERLKIMDKIAINLMLRPSLKIMLRCSGSNGKDCIQEINVLTYGGDQKLIQFFVRTAWRQKLEFGYWYTIKETSHEESFPLRHFERLPKSIPPDTVPNDSIVLLAEYKKNRCTSIYFQGFRKPWPTDKIIIGIFDQHNLNLNIPCVTHCPCGLRWESADVQYDGNAETMRYYKWESFYHY